MAADTAGCGCGKAGGAYTRAGADVATDAKRNAPGGLQRATHADITAPYPARATAALCAIAEGGEACIAIVAAMEGDGDTRAANETPPDVEVAPRADATVGAAAAAAVTRYGKPGYGAQSAAQSAAVETSPATIQGRRLTLSPPPPPPPLPLPLPDEMPPRRAHAADADPAS